MENKNRTILIVEDEQTLSKALAKKLEALDFRVLRASDGEEGLRMAQTESPDLILLDIIMPKMNGTAMFKKFRKSEQGKSVPIIILTNIDSENNPELANLAEQNEGNYLVKSDWQLTAILEKIEAVLEEKKEKK